MRAKPNLPRSPHAPRPSPAALNGPLGLLPPWLVTVVRPAALTLLVGCLALPLSQILAALIPGKMSESLEHCHVFLLQRKLPQVVVSGIGSMVF